MLSETDFMDKRQKLWLNKSESEKADYLSEIMLHLQSHLCESGLIYSEIETVLNLLLINMKMFKITHYSENKE